MNDSRTITLDIRGQVCPSTLLVTLRELNANRQALHNGEVQLVVRTDNRNATFTVPQAAENMGYQVEVRQEAGLYVMVITGGSAEAGVTGRG